MSGPSFDPGLQPEPCSSCGERVVRPRSGCPVCRARGLLGEPGLRPLVAAVCALPEGGPAPGWRIEPDGPHVWLEAADPASLRGLLAGLGRLGERSPLVPRPLRCVDRRLLVTAPAGQPLRPPLAPGALLSVAADLARLAEALAELGLAWPLTRDDLRQDEATGQVGVSPQALPRLELALGQDPRAASCGWGAILAELLGAPRRAGGPGGSDPGGYALEEASCAAPPALLAAVRAALRGEGAPHALLDAALGAALGPSGLPAAGPRPAHEARLATARAGAVATLDLEPQHDDPQRGPFLLLARDAASTPDVAAWLALDLQLDAVVRLELPAHAEADPAAVLARREAFRAARADGLLTGPPLDPALRAARAPAVRGGEPYAVTPCLLPADPAPPPPAAAAPPPVLVASARGSTLTLTVEAAPEAEAVLLVRGRPGQALLLPEDGELLRALDPGDLPATVEDPAPGPGARYAAFPLRAGVAGPPARTGGTALEVRALTATPGIGAIELTWEAPAGAVVLLRAGAAPLQGPADGQPLLWARERQRLVHDCLDPDQEVHYLACALGPGGTLSAGLAASAVALGPPPALGEVRASSQVGRVTLAWTWPAGRSYDRVRVRREPGWPEGEREVLRAAEPCLVDADAPLGRRLGYTLRTALGSHVSRLESEAAGAALAEVAALHARPAGGAVELELELPPGLPAGSEVQVCRNLEREPRDMQDGTPLTVGPELRLLDGSLEPGRPAWYRACLVLDGRRSPGVVARATPVEPAGPLREVAVEGQQGRIVVRFTPPAERCERVMVLAAPRGEPLREVECGNGGPVEIEATPGVPWRVRLVPVHQGCADAAQGVEREATAWDDLSELAAEPGPDGVLLRWRPPAGSPAGYLLEHRPKGRADEPWTQLRLPAAQGEHLLALPPRRTYELRLRCAWGEGPLDGVPAHTVEATALALPPALGDPELALAPGEVRARYLPAPPSERLHWERTVLYLSERAPGQVRAALAGREWFRDDEAAALGLREAASRPRAKQRETLSAPAPAQPGTALLASANGPLRRVLRLGPAVDLPADVLRLSPEPAAAPAVRWSRPALGPVRLARLVLRRGLEEAVDGLPAGELEELSLPRQHELSPQDERFEDQDALPYVSWGYQLEATLEADGERAEVQGPRLVVPAIKGGTLRPVPAQARGFLSKKQLIEVAFQAGPPTPRAWPAFELVRCVADQREGKVVARYAGGGPPPQVEDADLGAFTKGTRLTYRVRLVHARDRLGWAEGHATLTLG